MGKKSRYYSRFVNQPQAILGRYGVTINIFHYLDAYLEYVPEVDNEFQEWMYEPERENETWFSCVYEWCQNNEDSYCPSFLTYNYENLLSQDFQADTFSINGDDYCCLSIHGGCDIRGGYTRPRIFRIYESEMFGSDLDSFTVFTTDDRKSEKVVLDCRCGEIIEVESGSYIRNDDPLYKWANFWEDSEGYPIWDDEKDMWIAPDKDGYLDVDVYFGC